jgi:hypothetical protein
MRCHAKTLWFEPEIRSRDMSLFASLRLSVSDFCWDCKAEVSCKDGWPAGGASEMICRSDDRNKTLVGRDSVEPENNADFKFQRRLCGASPYQRPQMIRLGE